MTNVVNFFEFPIKNSYFKLKRREIREENGHFRQNMINWKVKQCFLFKNSPFNEEILKDLHKNDSLQWKKVVWAVKNDHISTEMAILPTNFTTLRPKMSDFE